MAIIHVSLEFAKLADPYLDDFASNVVVKMTGNASFATPAVSLTVLGAAQVTFHNSISAALSGGLATTVAKKAARTALVGLLRQQAVYVEGVANGNLTVLLSSGFKQRGTPGPSSALTKPQIKSLANGNSTQLVLTLVPVANARSYEVQVRTGTGAWVTVVTSGKSRGIILPGLVPGTMYDVQARAIGGSTGYSDWSDPVSHMCM